jgi:transposase
MVKKILPKSFAEQL